MTQLLSLRVPAELKHPLFFSNEETILEKEDYNEWNCLIQLENFPYELLFYNKVESYLPWKDGDGHVPELLEKWKEIEAECGLLFSERKAGQALEPMKQGIGLFLSAVYWMQGMPVVMSAWQGQIKDFTYIPVNMVERLSFILARPAFFHSYRQLSELFREFEKQYVKSRIKK
ncbi:YpoC family protein [Peribacillus butanolivorans]|uniref:YpoC family protein n=1 Tax=Peribacillus butanolivorans TaxID=421767 RepID=UPI0036700D02